MCNVVSYFREGTVDFTPIIDKVQKFGATTIIGILFFWLLSMNIPDVHAGYPGTNAANATQVKGLTGVFVVTWSDIKANCSMVSKFPTDVPQPDYAMFSHLVKWGMDDKRIIKHWE